MSSLNHASQTGADNIHEFAVNADSDPGAIGIYKAWFNTSTGVIKVRNATNTGWIDVEGAAGSGVVPAATETLAGKAELATQAETNAGTDDARIVTPLKLATDSKWATKADLSGGKVPTSQLPDTVLGGLDYQGTWNASTNSPNIGASSPTKGDYYKVTTAGTTSLSGIAEWAIGDWAVYDGAAWDKVDNSESGSAVPSASETVEGKAELATDAEADTGTDDLRIMTPKKVFDNYIPRVSGLGTTLDLDSLEDVEITSPTDEDGLIRRSGVFVNEPTYSQSEVDALIAAVGGGSTTPETPTVPTFQNFWADADATNYNPCTYYKHDGRVWFEGIIGAGTTGTTAFTLPSGYRPPKKVLILSWSATDGLSYFQFHENGDVQGVRAGASISLEGMSFRHA